MGFRDLSNLQQRIIAGVIGGGLMFGALWYNSFTYFLLWGIILVMSQIEFFQLLEKSGTGSRLYSTLLVSVYFYITSFLIWLDILSWKFFLMTPVLLLLVYLSELFQKESKPFEFNAYSVLNVIYLTAPIVSLHFISHYDKQYHFSVIMGVLLLLWGNDIGGYFAGRAFGKHKLFERISPKKTWEGTLGGLFLSLIASVGVYKVSGIFSIEHWMVLSIIVVVFGSLGDLVESQLKRSIDIKDSGSFIPGHGGFLDRFDGLFFCAAPCAAYIQLVILK
jgi:phosphatidate cytidylyltransferase